MGAYKSRPASVCADEWKRKLAESYTQVLSRLKDDTTLQAEDREFSSLHQACSDGKIDAVRQLANLSTVNEKSNSGLTAFHVCCTVGGPIMVALVLLERGAKTSLLTNRGFAALHQACYKGATELVGVLINDGEVDIHQHGMNKVTSLHVAAMCGHQQVNKNEHLCYNISF
jgi:ankyrin repeat protein